MGLLHLSLNSRLRHQYRCRKCRAFYSHLRSQQHRIYLRTSCTLWHYQILLHILRMLAFFYLRLFSFSVFLGTSLFRFSIVHSFCFLFFPFCHGFNHLNKWDLLTEIKRDFTINEGNFDICGELILTTRWILFIYYHYILSIKTNYIIM